MSSLQARNLYVALSLTMLCTAAAAGQTVESVIGTYRRTPVQNPWHEGQILEKPGSGGAMLQWKNKAGVTWNLIPDLTKGVLNTDETNPYFKKGGRDFTLEIAGGNILSFTFQGDVYSREGSGGPVARIAQKSGGLKGYISMSLGPVPAGYGYGVSFYVAAWPLLAKPLAGFQIGLPSTWITPDNRDFMKPLCPPGTVARDHWPERGPYYRDVFQTIEGGLGFWVSTQFASGTPKYRMNGTPNGYNHEISSPGWGFGKPEALAPEQMGIAQLSNHLLVPPDGLTFKNGTAGELLGNAWMAIPFTSPKSGSMAPTGDQSWTLFLNTENFKGPVAFWIPETWSRLSQSYRDINGRGLDARPGRMGGGAMEVNTVPYMEAKNAQGIRYTRIPRMQYPVNAQGETVLMQDVIMYSEEALFSRFKTKAHSNAGPMEWLFNPKAAFRPTLVARPISMKQGEQNLALQGIGDQVQTKIVGEAGKQAFGLTWKNAHDWGIFPEYYREEGGKMAAVADTAVPKETGLAEQAFRAGAKGRPYSSPTDVPGVWTKPGPKAGPFTATLTDGSVVTYSWYRFIDQPSIVALNWTEAERSALQALIERLHKQWSPTGEYMAEPSSGKLVTLDTALRVEPPQGLEAGYVPIVTRQSAQP